MDENYQALTNMITNFKQLCLERAVTRTHNIKLKEILKRRALFPACVTQSGRGNQTVVLLNPSFFYFFNPFFVISNSWATVLTSNLLPYCNK
jgi:hypothetical protein